MIASQLAIVLLLAIIAAGCSDSGGARLSPAPSDSLTAVSPMATSATGVTPSPTAASQFYEPGTTTGVPAVDSVIAAAEKLDTPALVAQTHYFNVPCDGVENIGLPPCPAGVEQGTQVEASLHGNCDRAWVTRTVIEQNEADLRYFEWPLRLYAVAKVTLPMRPIVEGGQPPASYLVVFGQENPNAPSNAVGFLIDDQGIVKFALGCNQDPAQLMAAGSNGNVTGFVLPPRS